MYDIFQDLDDEFDSRTADVVLKPLNPSVLTITENACGQLEFELIFSEVRQLRCQVHNVDEDGEMQATLSFYNRRGELLELSHHFDNCFHSHRVSSPLRLREVGLTARRLPGENDKYELATIEEAPDGGWLYVPEPEADDDISHLSNAMIAKTQRREGRHANARC